MRFKFEWSWCKLSDEEGWFDEVGKKTIQQKIFTN